MHMQMDEAGTPRPIVLVRDDEPVLRTLVRTATAYLTEPFRPIAPASPVAEVPAA